MERHVIDQQGSSVSFQFPPSRIVSLVPSQTELLFDLGLHDQITGITKFCVHPPGARKYKTIVGGTKRFDVQKIVQLDPHLVVANKEENDRERIESLREKVPVWVSDISSLKQAILMIRSVGSTTDREEEAERIISRIGEAFSECPLMASSPTALYLIWRRPWMAAGSGTFIHSMLGEIGLLNAVADKPRYPILDIETLARLNPEHILLSSEPFPFRGKHVGELQEICPSSRIHLVDGEMFSWYGSRLIKAVTYFKSLPFINGR